MICTRCGGEVKHRDWVNRVVRCGDAGKITLRVERLQCKECHYIFRNLPEELEKFKQYPKHIMENSYIWYDEGFEDFPSESSIKRWSRIK